MPKGFYQRASVEVRFWRRVDKNGKQVPGMSQCWAWKGKFVGKGYPTITVNGGTARANRVSHELFVGPIPEGLIVCHRCDNPECTNPEHLFVGTWKDNVHDMISKGRQRYVYGEDHHWAKLTWGQVHYIRRTYKRFTRKYGVPALARRLGVGRCAIICVLQNVTFVDPDYTPAYGRYPGGVGPGGKKK